MDQKLSALSERYARALNQHLTRQLPADVQKARELGCRALAIGLETLDMARIHERALAQLGTVGGKDGHLRRATLFFAEAIGPIEETHRAAVKSRVRLNRMNSKLGKRTLDLAASNRSVKRRTAQRKAVEAALRASGEHFQTLLKESLELQNHLQQMTHKILQAQENERKVISHELQDEIAQTLLGINVRLLTVRNAAGREAGKLSKEISSTQRLVDKSKRNLERFAREYGKL